MSGKSTLLRTVGVNVVLALAGGPVCARRLTLSRLAIGATLRIHDSLQEGRSRFYAEITRLRQIVELGAGPVSALFLLDELLSGTNSHDRRAGAEAIHRQRQPLLHGRLRRAYGEVGLGPERADHMVRSASVLRRHIPLSFHSDLPMGPSDPLFLAWAAVNRLTPSGRVAAPEQRISVADALRALTIEAAYSWRKEDELGSIAPRKIANFTVLADDPLATEPARLKDISIWGTVFEGRLFPIPPELRRGPRPSRRPPKGQAARWHAEHDHGADSCGIARGILTALSETLKSAFASRETRST